MTAAELWDYEDWVDVNLLASLVERLEEGRPRWHAWAACRGRGDIDWFSVAGVEAAVAVCGGCRVRQPCRVAGAREAGVWGGQASRASVTGELVPGRHRRRAS